jgi:hypothetical protein
VKLNKWVLRENIKFRLFFARLEKTRNLGLRTKKKLGFRGSPSK